MKITSIANFLLVLTTNLLAYTNGDRTKNKMYETIWGSAACIRRLNGTHQMGCSSQARGSTGVIHWVESEQDLDVMLRNGSAPPYTPVMPTTIFGDYNVTHKLLDAASKISGVVVYKKNETLEHLSHDSQCPNARSGLGNTCSKTWNPYGTGLFYEDVPFTMFYIKNDEDVAKLKNCFEKFNNYSLETQAVRSLCAIEIDAFMYATVNTPTCIRRSEHKLNLKNINFCDPVGGTNFWTSIYPHAVVNSSLEPTDTKYIVIATKLDATSLFYGIVPGASSPITGIVTLLTTARLLKQLLPMEDDYKKYGKNVLFLFLNGESYDYIGSQRLVFDMENGDFPFDADILKKEKIRQIRPENISLFIELSQLSHNPKVVTHIYEEPEEIKSFYNKLVKYKKDLNIDKSVGILPPASLQSFINARSTIPGLVLADHRDEYLNNFYNSIYDNASNIGFKYTQDDDDLKEYSASIAEMVAYAVFEEVTGNAYEGNERADVSLVNELYHCYLEDPNCLVHYGISKKRKQEAPYNMYVGVSPHGHNHVADLIGTVLAWFTGDIVKNPNNTCIHDRKNHTFRYFNFSKSINEINDTSCYRTTLNYAEAVSPAFVIPDYDWSSGQYSSWTESSWVYVSVRIFLKPSAAHENMTLILGSLTMLFSMIFVYYLKTRSHVLFPAPDIPVPTNC